MVTIPSLETLQTNILASLLNELGITSTLTKKVFLIPLSFVMAGIAKILYYSLGQAETNMWIFTNDTNTLLRFGYIILGRYPYPATAAQYSITVTGTIGATIPSGTVFNSNNTATNAGKLYILPSAHIMSSTSEQITVVALAAGTGSLLVDDDALTATAPILNVSSNAIVYGEVVPPIDAETIPEYKAKMIAKVQIASGSWSAGDYRLISQNVIGVRTAYAYARSGESNTVDLYIEGLVYGTVPSADSTVVNNVQEAIDLVKPLGIFLCESQTCATQQIIVTITMGDFPSFSDDQKDLIELALRDFINTIRPFIAACDAIQSKNDIINSSVLYPVISSVVPGYGYSSLTFTVDGDDTINYTSDLGRIPYLNSVIFA